MTCRCCEPQPVTISVEVILDVYGRKQTVPIVFPGGGNKVKVYDNQIVTIEMNATLDLEMKR